MRVSLPMYDLAEFREEHEALWHGLSGALRRVGFNDLPATLEWPSDLFELWRSPDMLLSQTCGLPFVRELAGAVQLVAVPHYAVVGCEGYHYSSALVVARDMPYRALEELRGRVAGFNESVSQSGYNTLRHAVAPLAGGKPFFARVEETGRHEASIDAILAGEIDVAAIDAVTLTLFKRCRPERARGLRVLAFTTPAPGLPLITSRDTSPQDLERLRFALGWLFEASEMAAVRAKLMLSGISFPDVVAYQSIAEQERRADALGYSHLH